MIDASGDLLKSHVKGYAKKNGVFVAEHDDKRVKHDKPMAFHPQKGMKGEKVIIKNPHEETRADTWDMHNEVATVTPGGLMPYDLNDVPFESWVDHPTTDKEWADVGGQLMFDEPEMEVPKGKKPASGVVIEEDDGRIWLIHPTNSFGGYDASFPKGGLEDGLSMQANAIKEAYEESGLKIEITGFIGDVLRTTSVARYYSAKRVGGDPADMGWESQAVSLVPRDMLGEIANTESDAELIKLINSDK